MVKFVYYIDYPLGGKKKYLSWVKSNAPVLQEPEELKRLSSYDNYLGASPQRVLEFEFENMEKAGKYFDRENIANIQQDLVNHGMNVRVDVFTPRTDYDYSSGMSYYGWAQKPK